MFTAIAAQSGSSPQVRGKHPQSWCGDAETGLIPAGAGQTVGARFRRLVRRAHPRRCGANKENPMRNEQERGSSPQVRGKLDQVRRDRDLHGLIPAGAGQTAVADIPSAAARAHPRRCGANQALGDKVLNYLGSSPQVRGKHLRQPLLQFAGGLIPAGAGQTRPAA